MTLKNMILESAVILFSTLTLANEGTVESVTPDHNPGNPSTAWECSAHNSYNEYEIYYGEASYSRSVARSSAIHECEHHEAHQCVVHECHPTYGY